MRVCVRLFLVLACLFAVQSTAWAQATIAGSVKDSSGAVLPGVTVEAASPALIEKVRTTTTDGAGRYRIEDLRPGTYSVTYTLPGFVTIKRDGVIVSGTAVIAIDTELRVGGVQETVTVSGETPVVDVQSTKREVTLDNETLRNLPSVRSYSYLLSAVPGLQTNNNNVNTGPVFAIFPIHGGRGVESRLTVDGLNISNPPGGNQPSNYVADVGNASEVTMTTSGGLGESETAGLTVNIVPRQGGNSMSGMLFYSGFSKGMQSSNYDPELAQRGVLQPILLRPHGEGFEIVAGERRWRAAQRARLHTIPALVREIDDSSAAEIALIENIQREDLNAIEEAEGYRQLIQKHAHTQDGVAKLVHKSRSHVANLLRLLDLPEFVRQSLVRGDITMGHARAVATAPDPEELTKEIIAKGLSVRQAEDHARKVKPGAGHDIARGSARNYKQPADADLLALQRQLGDMLGLKVDVAHNGKKGTVTLHYSSLDQLDMICQRLSGEPI